MHGEALGGVAIHRRAVVVLRPDPLRSGRRITMPVRSSLVREPEELAARMRRAGAKHRGKRHTGEGALMTTHLLVSGMPITASPTSTTRNMPASMW